MHFMKKEFPRQGAWAVDNEGRLGVLFLKAQEDWGPNPQYNPNGPNDASNSPKILTGMRYVEEFHLVKQEDGETYMILQTPWSELTQASMAAIKTVKLPGGEDRVHKDIPEEVLVRGLGYSG